MVEPLAVRNLCKETSGVHEITLRAAAGSQDGWNKVMLCKAGGTEFQYSVRRISGRYDMMVGIADSTVNMNADGYNQGCYVYMLNGIAYYLGATSSFLQKSSIETLYVRYVAQPLVSVEFSVDGTTFVKYPTALPDGNYCPCVLTHWTDTVLAFEMDMGCHGSKQADHCKLMMHEVWQQRCFSDCKISCGTTVLQCHRSILAAASPVWRTAFESDFREGHEALIRIDDVEPSSVEDVLKYVYTGEFETSDVAAVLALAHRYEIPHLVGVCSRQMLKAVTVENVAGFVSALAKFHDHPEVAEFWSRLADKVRSDAALTTAVMRAVRV